MGITSECPIIRSRSMPSVEIASYKPTLLLIGRFKSALVSKRVSLCSRLLDTRYLVWIDRNLISTLQDRHRTHGATRRIGKAQKRLPCRPLATHGRAAGPPAVQGCGRRLDRNDAQQQ